MFGKGHRNPSLVGFGAMTSPLPRALTLGFYFALASVTSASATEDIPGKLDALFRTVSGDPAAHFSGNVLVAESGKVIYKNSIGYAAVGQRIPNSDATRFNLASLSKVFTAVAIMQLNERGRISLEDPLVKYLPEFPYPEITLRQLMSHTSGLPDFQIFSSYDGGNKGRLTNADLIPALRKWGKVFAPPGTKWSYSSVGIGLLALVVEKVSGVSFPRYVSENICQPAGMRSTYVDTLDPLKADPLRAVAYANPGADSLGLTPADAVKSDSMNPFQTIVGPGLVVSTAPDLLLFDQALYTDKLLHPASLDEMFTPAQLSDGSPAQFEGAPLYAGLVWGIDIDDSFGEIVSHNGGSPGIATILMRNLKTHDTVIVLENTDNRSALEFGLNAMNILLHRPPISFGPMQGPLPGVRGGPPSGGALPPRRP